MSTPTSDPDPLLLPPATAAMLNVTVQTLADWRCTKRYNLPYIKLGKLVRYRRSDVLRFIEEHRV